MNRINQSMPSDDNSTDLLISRLIDGEASSSDESAFEQLAEKQPQLWRDLALRQRDAVLLTAAVNRHAAAADQITPAQPQHDVIAFPQAARKHANWIFASAGWAAAIALLLLWRLAAPNGLNEPQNPNIQTAGQLTPEEQFRSYLQAPYVVGELDAVMERIDPLPDGRHAVLLQRRIQEVIFLDEDDALPVDDERHFVTDPAELRATSH